MTPEQRAMVRGHAVKLGGEVGDALKALIDSLGLPTTSGGMRLDDPVYCEMRDIVWSKEVRAAAIEAVANGLPALAAVDPLLQKAMGPRYRIEGQGRENAGSLVAEIMRDAGYEKTGKMKPLPAGCLAGSGALWRPKKPLKRTALQRSATE